MITTAKIRRFLIAWFFLAIGVNFVAAGDKSGETNKEESKVKAIGDGIFSGVHETNLIKNPGFENRTSSWTLGKYFGGAGIFRTDSIAPLEGSVSARIELSGQSEDYHDIQLFTSLPVTANNRYSIHFQASVAFSCPISITISNGTDTYFDISIVLKPDKRQYGPYIFESQQDDPLTSFAFNLGKAGTPIQIDDVRVRKDNTYRESEKMLSSTGINFYLNKGQKSFHVKLPVIAQKDYRVLFQKENGAIVHAGMINRGVREMHFDLLSTPERGAYTLKVMSPVRTLSYSFSIN